MSTTNKKSAIENIKEASDALRGTIKQSLSDEITGAIREDDQAECPKDLTLNTYDP